MSNHKLRLSLERLGVESFATHAAVESAAGIHVLPGEAGSVIYTGAAPCRPTGSIGDCSRYCQ